MIDAYDRKTADTVTLSLGNPISVNRLYRAVPVRGRTMNLLSAEYRQWKGKQGDLLERQTPACVPGQFKCSITLPKNCKLDLDNSAKAFLDLLQSHNVIENDRHMTELRIKRGDEKDVTQITISKESGKC